MPVGLSNDEQKYILMHEMTHIQRKDNIIKALAFAIAAIHWFNPLVWLAFILMSADMEMSCDEKVLKVMNGDIKKPYAQSLLSLAVGRHILTGNPLAFGEGNVKQRIKNVLKYKKPRFWAIALSIMIVAALGTGLLLNPKAEELEQVNEYNLKTINIEIGKFVEDNLAIIMSSPMEESDPDAYIRAHQGEYENIIKYGGEEALQYMLSQFERGNAEGLRGYIMMQLCKELLGARNNVTDDTLTPQEWYEALSIRQEIKLPDFEYDGTDPIEKLAYSTEVEMSSQHRSGFTIVAPKIFGSYDEDGKLKVFVTTYSAAYKLYGNVLNMESGSVVPAAITYRKDNNGSYVLEEYEQAMDGAEWLPSIKKFCTMPVSGKEIPGLANKIIKHYGNYDDIYNLHLENLFRHLKANGIEEAILFNPLGEIEFSMKKTQYIK